MAVILCVCEGGGVPSSASNHVVNQLVSWKKYDSNKKNKKKKNIMKLMLLMVTKLEICKSLGCKLKQENAGKIFKEEKFMGWGQWIEKKAS